MLLRIICLMSFVNTLRRFLTQARELNFQKSLPQIFFIIELVDQEMNLLEKITMLSLVGGSSLFGVYMYLKPNMGNKKEDAHRVRQQLLKDHSVRMLYSTMSFFYLQGFKQGDPQSFYKLKQILSIAKPNIVVLQLSAQEANEKYAKVMKHPKFEAAMQTFDYYIDNKDTKAILEMKDFELENLQKLYLMRYCKKAKCTIVHGQQNREVYKAIDNSAEKMKESLGVQSPRTSSQVMEDDYVDKAVAAFQAKRGFKILPDAPFKTIVGVADPEHISGISKKWKLKFKKDYGHNIIEDEEVVKRESEYLEAKSKSHY